MGLRSGPSISKRFIRGKPMRLEDGFSIAGHEVLPAAGLIHGSAGPRHVEPKAMEVLLELARHAPALRSRRQIEQVIWPRGFICADALTRCIGQLRRALGDEPRSPRLLQFIPRRGYRLHAQVQASAPAAREPARSMTLLVLPLLPLSPGADALLALGLTELLILRLCALPGLRVLSRTTSLQHQRFNGSLREIAARTGADWILEGSVLQGGSQLQMVAQLIDAQTDTHLWAGDFSGSRHELLALQNDLAERLAHAIHTQLERSGGPHAAATEAVAHMHVQPMG